MENLFVKGLIVGFCLAAPVGPIALLCVQRTIAHGKLAGYLSGLGASVADALYGTIAAFGVTVISAYLMSHRLVFQRAGGAILLVLGARLLLIRPPRAEEVDPDRGLWGDFFSTLVLTLTNPMTFIAFVAIFATLGIGAVRGHSVLTAELVAGVLDRLRRLVRLPRGDRGLLSGAISLRDPRRDQPRHGGLRDRCRDLLPLHPPQGAEGRSGAPAPPDPGARAARDRSSGSAPRHTDALSGVRPRTPALLL